LKQTPSARRAFRDGTFEARAVGGRVLIVLTALLIAVSPWTEYYWHFDNFLHGGQDFEFGLLSTIMVFCLVLVLIQHSKQGVTFLLALRRWLSVIFRHPDPASPSLSFRSLKVFHAMPLPNLTLGMYDLPLRI
jgi:hypothetical protein